MTTMLERAARALCGSMGEVWDDESSTWKSIHTSRARAVLMAVRDSTDAMNVSAEEAELPGGQFGEPGFRESSIDELDAPVIWRAMIDAILNEEKTND